MVAEQLEFPRDGRPRIRDPRVLSAVRAVPRHAFVPREQQRYAYEDRPLPIGLDQTISQPYIVALMTELLEVAPGSRVLEVGTGSGYQAAVLAHLTPHVWSIEIVAPLADRARSALAAEGYDTVVVRTGDGYQGWPEHAPFDAILLTCAAPELPAPLWDQLRPGGRVVMPLGDPRRFQELVVIEKTHDGQRNTRRVTPVAFVPMTGEIDER
jgi:protein-L-isoaspartate(D-aspartate) O-methyltransferase